MKGCRRLSILALLAFLVSGCTGIPPLVNVTQVGKYKKVGVISLSAHTLWRQHVGFTVFGNERESRDIGAWDLDSVLATNFKAAIEKVGGIEVVDGKYSKEEFLHIYDLNGPWSALIFLGPNWKAISGYTRNYCAANAVDGVLITYGIVTEDFFGDTNQFVSGVGIYTRGAGDSTQIALLHVVAEVGLVDCRTNQPVAKRSLSPLKHGTIGGILRAAPTLKMDPLIARKTLAQLTADEETMLKQAVVELHERTWDPSFRFMFSR